MGEKKRGPAGTGIAVALLSGRLHVFDTIYYISLKCHGIQLKQTVYETEGLLITMLTIHWMIACD